MDTKKLGSAKELGDIMLSGVSSEWREILDITEFRTSVNALYERYTKELTEKWYKNELLVKNLLRPNNISDILNAFKYAPPGDIHTIIVGQDPYPDPNTACGLSFSTPMGYNENAPMSVKNIFKALEKSGLAKAGDVGSGQLIHWALQGFLMLNIYLTRETLYRIGTNKDTGAPTFYYEGEGNSDILHDFWEDFTITLVQNLARRKKLNIVLWGSRAKQMAVFLQNIPANIMEYSHPVARGNGMNFDNCPHFTELNKVIPGVRWTIDCLYPRSDTGPGILHVFDETSELSMWYPREFTISGVVFTSIGHYIYYKKSVMFNIPTDDLRDALAVPDPMSYVNKKIITNKPELNKKWLESRGNLAYEVIKQTLKPPGSFIYMYCVKNKTWGTDSLTPEFVKKYQCPGDNIYGRMITKFANEY